MQYFKKELWRAVGSEDREVADAASETCYRNRHSYRAQLDGLATRLSKTAFRFFTRVSLHDGRLLDWTVGEGIDLLIADAAQYKRRPLKLAKARIRVITYERDLIYELHYSRVHEAQFAFPHPSRCSGGRERGSMIGATTSSRPSTADP